jgi:hypothetical protein
MEAKKGSNIPVYPVFLIHPSMPSALLGSTIFAFSNLLFTSSESLILSFHKFHHFPKLSLNVKLVGSLSSAPLGSLASGST